MNKKSTRVEDFALQCPVCQQPLHTEGNSLRCQQGHCFDKAKQGYTNLLLAQHKRSRSPGDDKAMVDARSRFLALGRYQPLADTLLKKIEKFWPDANHWLDLGCGEGWYTHQIQQDLPNTQGIGIDISKEAVAAAGKRSKDITWLVASGSRIPLFDDSVDAGALLFTRIFASELSRVIKPGGSLVTVGSGEEHLLQLRQTLYPKVNQSNFDAAKELEPLFKLDYQKEIKFEWIPDSEQELLDLLTMTPHHWRATTERKSQIVELINKPMIAHFMLQIWENCGPGS